MINQSTNEAGHAPVSRRRLALPQRWRRDPRTAASRRRAWLDRAAPVATACLGLALTAATSYAIVAFWDWFLGPLIADQWVRLAVGVGWAFVIAFGESFTSERGFLAYLWFYLPDVAAGVWWSWPGWQVLIARGGAVDLAVLGWSLLIAAGSTAVAAYYGEVLLFGRRRVSIWRALSARLTGSA